MAADQQYPVVADDAVRLGQARLAVADRFHLRTGQHDAGLIGLEDMVVVPCAAVGDGHGQMLRGCGAIVSTKKGRPEGRP